MLKELTGIFPIEALKILLVLSLSFLIGLEREEHKVKVSSYTFGGVRTFPLIGLLGFLSSFLSNNSPLGIGLGFIVVGSFLLVSYLHKIKLEGSAGVTTEITGLLTYLLGALVNSEKYWIATAIVVLTALLLELKEGLENLAQKLDSEEIATFTQFLLVSCVILPIVPNQYFTIFEINPFKTWLVIVAVSAISYGSYAINKLSKGKGGPLVTAILGGAYSSTATTIVLSRRAKEEGLSYLFAGCTLVASSIMYLRVFILVFFFNKPLAMQIFFPFLFLFLVGFIGGFLISKKKVEESKTIERKYNPKNPLQLKTAFLFGLIFIVILSLTKVAISHFGSEVLYLLAFVMGFSDVDPFIMSLTQTSSNLLSLLVSAKAIIIATSSNNLLKGLYSSFFGEKKMGRISFLLLLIYALLGIFIIFFME